MYLVTGGAGFIGSHLVEALLSRGERVRVLDNLSTGRVENLDGLRDDVELVVADIRDADAVTEAMSGVEVVLHQAALPSVPRSIADPRTSVEANVMGTTNVLDAARLAGVRRFVHASSSSVYGNSPTLPKHIDMRPLPRSPYAVAKLAAETLGQAYFTSFGLETVALRYFNVFGPRQDPTSAYAAVIPRFITAVHEGQPVPMHGDGMQARDFTFIENVVNANLLAATTRKPVGGEVFNIATGTMVTLHEMLDEICAVLGPAVSIDYQPERTGDVRHSLADRGPAEALLGWSPTVDFREGLRRTIESLVPVGQRS